MCIFVLFVFVCLFGRFFFYVFVCLFVFLSQARQIMEEKHFVGVGEGTEHLNKMAQDSTQSQKFQNVEDTNSACKFTIMDVRPGKD